MHPELLHPKLQVYIDKLSALFGLDEYRFARYSLHREVNVRQETVYMVSLEFFPLSARDVDVEEGNPLGTFVAQIDMRTGGIKSVIFVGGISFAQGIHISAETITNQNVEAISQIIMKLSGVELTQPTQQFKIVHQAKNRVGLHACIGEIEISGFTIDLKCNDEGQLVMYGCYGDIPKQEEVRVEQFTLSLSQLDHIITEQVKLVSLPQVETKQWLNLYGIEEIWIRNNGIETYPYELLEDNVEKIQLDIPLFWTHAEPLPPTSPLQFYDEVSLEAALKEEPHPDLEVITKQEQQNCITSITSFCSGLYPDESGHWTLDTLRRKHGYIQGIIRRVHDHKEQEYDPSNKLVVMLDHSSFHVVNYICHSRMSSLLNTQQYAPAEGIQFAQKEALSRLLPYLELTPYYVWNKQEQQYILCAKLDCKYGVDTASGDVLTLDSI